MTGIHARCSASSAERWVNCPGSINEAAKYGDSTSFQAAEGTFAHHIAAVCLKEEKHPSEWLGNKTVVEGHVIECDQEVVDGVQLYLKDCYEAKAAGDQVWIEAALTDALKQLDPDLGGTADFIRWRPSEAHLLVSDFKYGAGVLVSAEDNRQLKTYALGAVLVTNKAPKKITVRIVQPRIDHPEGVIREETFDGIDIVDFAGELIAAAKATRAPAAPLVAGPWCRKTFCPAAHSCPALEKKQHALMTHDDFAVDRPYSVEALAAGLSMIDLLKAKIKSLEEFAYHEANRGIVIPGWKIVEKRPVRKWIGASETVAAELAQRTSCGADQFYHEPELKSPAVVEAMLGSKKKAEAALSGLLEKVSSGTTLVPAADKRPEIKRLSESDFAGGAAKALAPPAVNLFD